MEIIKRLTTPVPPLSLQEEFAPYRGSSTGMAAWAVVEPGRDIESLRGRTGESARQACAERRRSMEGLFESLLAEAKQAVDDIEQTLR